MSSNHQAENQVDCEALQELIPDYAFGLADAEAVRLVETSLPVCPEAAAQLADYRRLQDEMRVSVPLMHPPPQLGERLMAAVKTQPVTTAPRRQLNWLMGLAAAAVVALVITNLYWLSQVNALIQRQERLEAQLIQKGNTSETAFVLTSTSNLRTVRLPPSEQNGAAQAFLMWNIESEIGLLYVHDFPALATGKTYQLWLTRGEERTSAGTFQVDQDGKGTLLFHISGPIDQYTWARITDEPENGSREPTGPVVVVGQL